VLYAIQGRWVTLFWHLNGLGKHRMKKVFLTMVPNRLSLYNPVTVKSYPNGKLVYQPPPDQRKAGRFTSPNRWSVLTVQLRELNTRTKHRKSKKKFSVTAYVDDNYSSSLPALDRNRVCVVEVLRHISRCHQSSAYHPVMNASAYYPVTHRP